MTSEGARGAEPAVVLLSGGMDSAVTLALALRDGFVCHALSFDYGQRHRLELEAARKVARQLGAHRHLVLPIGLRAVGGSALTDRIAVPKDRLDAEGRAPAPRRAGLGSRRRTEVLEAPVTYVPARNAIFLACALGLAEAVGARSLFIGVNAVDYSGYPDCRPAFIHAFERMANLATKAGVEERGGRARFRVRAPLMRMSKGDIVRAGVELGVDFALTHTCYDPRRDGRPCGRCDACILRARGFAEAGVPDPALRRGKATSRTSAARPRRRR